MIKDFEKYFTAMQLDYNDAVKHMERVDEQAKQGLLTEEQRQMFVNWFMTVKSNYDRTFYMRYLLHLPPKFIQVFREKKLKNELNEFIENEVDLESIKKENKEALDNMSDTIEEVEECKNS